MEKGNLAIYPAAEAVWISSQVKRKSE